MTELWINNPSILLKNLNQFFISNELTDNENKNALIRFAIYFGLLIILFNENKQWLYLSLIIILISLFYSKNNIDILLNTKIKELFTSSKLESCYKPTKDNPFMNYTMGDLIETPLRNAACNYSDVKDKVKNEFKKHIFTDSYDIWGKNTSDRNFYTLPNTNIVNDQTEFDKWCFGDSGRCKSVGENCLKFKDPLYHRGRGN